MRESERPQSVVVAPLEMVQRDDRISPLEAQDKANRMPDRRRLRIGPIDAVVDRRRAQPQVEMLVQFLSVADRLEFARLLHDAVPGQLPLRLRPRLFRRIPARQLVKVRGVAADLRRHAETDASPPHFREADSVVAAIHPITSPGRVALNVLPPSNAFLRPPEVPVVHQRVHRQIEVQVEDQRRLVHVSCPGGRADGSSSHQPS